jgi:hypothetical protein
VIVNEQECRHGKTLATRNYAAPEALILKHLAVSDVEHFIETLAIMPLGNANAQ